MLDPELVLRLLAEPAFLLQSGTTIFRSLRTIHKISSPATLNSDFSLLPNTLKSISINSSIMSSIEIPNLYKMGIICESVDRKPTCFVDFE